ncbi:MAG: hypothetical protein LQ348_000500 [Seirophora lacunosa]|nr:MAG: hypothetical protein LQ344_004753 [Seirophora lacunosa]KAI4207706.1 MAG: hypothetical protein LQ348_000500 [Seirophora lacunosa]
MASSNWRTIRDRKLAQQRSQIPKEWLIPNEKLPSDHVLDVTDVPRTCGILLPRELHVTEDYDARSLAAAIRNRQFTAVEVTTAFCKRAAISHQLLHTLTEPLFHSALSRARFLDEHLASSSTPLGPLHGLPISVKDTFSIEGHDATVGISALAFHPSPSTAPLVKLLLAAGAVIHCKTNVPQTMAAMDSVNNIFGRVLNPLNRENWTAGGSSGGEAALVRMRGCTMGVGTDVGGSVRVPAAVNGIVGLKPGSGRVSTRGMEEGREEGKENVGLQSVVGPIASRLDDLALFMEVVEKGRMWKVDPQIRAEKGWWTRPGSSLMEQKTKEKSLRVGIIYDDGNTMPLPPIRRMLGQLTDRLEDRGVRTVPIDPIASGFSKCQSLANKFFSAQGNTHLLSLIQSTGEPLIPWLAPRLKPKDAVSLDQLRVLMAQRDEIEYRMLALWEDLDIDLIICPVAPHPVPPPDRWNAIGYTSAFVLLDYPAGVVQVSVVEEGDLEEGMEGELRGEWDRVNRALWHEEMKKGYLGSPLAVQVVASKGRERWCWEGMRVVEEMGRGEGERRTKSKL